MKNKKPFIILLSIVLVFCIVCVVGVLLFGWTAFSNEFTHNLNQPVPLIGISFGTALMFFLVVFSKTKLGKESLEGLKNGINVAKEETQKARDTLNEAKKSFDEFKEAKEEEIKTIKETTKIMIDGARQETRAYRDLLIDISREINNVNIQNKVDEFIKENTTEIYEDTSEIITNAKKEAVKEYDSQIVDLRKEIEDIKLFMNDNKKEALEVKEDIKNEIQDNSSIL